MSNFHEWFQYLIENLLAIVDNCFTAVKARDRTVVFVVAHELIEQFWFSIEG